MNYMIKLMTEIFWTKYNIFLTNINYLIYTKILLLILQFINFFYKINLIYKEHLMNIKNEVICKILNIIKISIPLINIL